MTTNDCTASSADSKNLTYPSLVNSSTIIGHIAEDKGEYTTGPSTDLALAQSLKHLELKATSKTIAGQITRLYGLVSLLLPDEQPTDRTGDELRQLAIELEQATAIIEQTVNSLIEEIVAE